MGRGSGEAIDVSTTGFSGIAGRSSVTSGLILLVIKFKRKINHTVIWNFNLEIICQPRYMILTD